MQNVSSYCCSGQSNLSCRSISKKIKIKTHGTTILPDVLYEWETWSLILREEHNADGSIALFWEVTELHIPLLWNVTERHILFFSDDTQAHSLLLGCDAASYSVLGYGAASHSVLLGYDVASHSALVCDVASYSVLQPDAA